jgi:hypothetical protein
MGPRAGLDAAVERNIPSPCINSLFYKKNTFMKVAYVTNIYHIVMGTVGKGTRILNLGTR